MILRERFVLLILFVLMIIMTVTLPDCRPAGRSRSGMVSIIPCPDSLVLKNGIFRMNGHTRINIDPEIPGLDKTAGIFRDEISKYTGIEVQVSTEAIRHNCIILTIDGRESMQEEAYRLSVTPRRIRLTASTLHGIWNGLQSLKQLIITTEKKDDYLPVPAMEINDKPRFEWRGMHLDVSRHFFTADSVKRYIDFLALYKFNRFHWHLTDDQGWRIEITRYPELTRKGAWRKTGENDTGNKKGIPAENLYGGFYTRDEIRDIVTYASERFVTVVPEIEMPGHSQAAIAAYPELGVKGEKLEVKTKWGISPNIYGPFDPAFEFLRNVLDEVTELFPSHYIHIGGDEAIKDQWQASEDVQMLIGELGLGNEDELQTWFINRIGGYLAEKGKRIIGWDEILNDGLAGGSVIMSWRGMQGGINAAGSGYDVIMTPYSHCYLNFSQSENEPASWAKRHFTSLEKVYSFDPVPAELGDQEVKHILGAQGCVWTEHLPSFRMVENKIFPRITALSEVLWSDTARRDFTDYMNRLRGQISLFEKLNINYYGDSIP
jgi:hexosaminidase